MKAETVFTLSEGRAYEVWNRHICCKEANTHTWCALFKTKSWRRMDTHTERLTRHGHWLVWRLLLRNGYPRDVHWVVRFERKDKYRFDSPFLIKVHVAGVSPANKQQEVGDE